MKVEKKKLTVRVNQKVKIKAKAVRKNGKLTKKLAKLRYEVTDSTICKVTSKGTVKGLKAGKTTVWVFTQNGIGKKVTVTVKNPAKTKKATLKKSTKTTKKATSTTESKK